MGGEREGGEIGSVKRMKGERIRGKADWNMQMRNESSKSDEGERKNKTDGIYERKSEATRAQMISRRKEKEKEKRETLLQHRQH